MTVQICDFSGECATADITIIVESVGPRNVFVYNAVSPNNDGKHDILEIVNITDYPENSVKIFNRWGEKIFEINRYDNQEKVFSGRSNLAGKKELPAGTYYYVIDLNEGSPKISGFFVLNR